MTQITVQHTGRWHGDRPAMAHRSFRDSFGRRWEAWSVVPTDAGDVDGAPADSADRARQEFRALLGREWSHGWLAFETSGEKRRLTPIPDDWENLPPAELERLLDRAKPVRPSRRLVE